MNNLAFGIDLGTSNIRIYNSVDDNLMREKNMIATMSSIRNKLNWELRCFPCGCLIAPSCYVQVIFKAVRHHNVSLKKSLGYFFNVKGIHLEDLLA